MNDELAKAGAYNALKKKQVTAWADLRNNVAHGNYTAYTSVTMNAPKGSHGLRMPSGGFVRQDQCLEQTFYGVSCQIDGSRGVTVLKQEAGFL